MTPLTLPARFSRVLFLLCGLLIGAVAPASASPAQTAANAAPGLTQADARQLLGVLNDPQRRAAFITTLTNMAKAVRPPTPAAKAAAAAGLAPDSLGAEVLTSAGALGGALSRQATDLQRAMRDFRDLGPWLRSIVGDPVRRGEVVSALARLVVVLGASLLTVVAINRLLNRPIGVIARWSAGMAPADEAAHDEAVHDEAVLRTHDEAVLQTHDKDGLRPGEPDESADLPATEEVARTRHNVSFRRLVRALARLPFALAHLLLELLPVVGFAAVAFLLELAGFVGNAESRLVVETALRCFIVAGALIAIVNTLFAPGSPSLRLLLVSDRMAALVTFWLRTGLLVGAWGFSSIFVMQTLGLSAFASLALAKALMLLEHTLLAGLIVRSRRDVAHRLQPPRRVRGVPRRILATLAARWWIYAIVLDYAFWIIWALDIKNGYATLWKISLETLLVAVGARLVWIALLGGLARGMRFDDPAAGRYPWMRTRAERYYPIMRRLVTIATVAATLIVLLEVWGIDALAWFNRGALGDRLFSALIGIMASLAIGVLIWEAVNIALDRHIDRLGRDPIAGTARVARVRTLLPILRIMLSIALVTIIALTVLSEIGVNIAPLLGGAGIIGVAIGFGSQKLVQDFITGIFLLLENAMQVGDGVTVSGLSGAVEHLSIRTIRLRAGDGSVHIIPFSSVTTVTNSNRGVGNAPVSVDIAPDEDTDHAGMVLRQVALTLRSDPDYKDGMLSELQLWGVDKVTSQAVTLVGQIACTDRARYGVQREFNRRMRIAFADEGIRLAMPAQSVMMLPDAPKRPSHGHDAIGHDAEGPENVTDSPPTSALGHGA